MRILTVSVLLAFAVTSAPAAPAQALEPMVVGAERLFSLEWGLGQRGNRPVVRGSVTNDAPYTVRDLQLLVEALDASGAVVAHEVTEVASQLTASSRSYFEVRAQASSSITYRVRVFAFDPVDGCGD